MSLPTIEVTELPLCVVRLPVGFTCGSGTTGSKFGLLDEQGRLCWVAKDWRVWV